MGGMATDPSSLSSPKAEGGSAFSPAGPNPAPRGNAAPSFIRSDFAGMDAAGPGASFGGGSPAGPVRGNRKRVRKVSEFNPSSYGKGFENRHVLTLGQDEEGETPTARGQDSSSQIMSILRRRREGEQATTQAKTAPQTTVTPPPGMPTLKTPDGRTPRNLLESAQALAAWRQAQEAATPTAQPNGIQPAVFRPGQSLPGGFMPTGEDGIVKAQMPTQMPMPMPPPFPPVPIPQPGQGTMPTVEEINRMTDWLGEEVRKSMQRTLPHSLAGQAFLLGQVLMQTMDAAEPLPPLPPSEAQKGGPTSFPGLDPDQGRADSASRPLITPVPQESMPTTTGGYGEERGDLPDMSIIEIQPHSKHEPYPQPSNDLSGKDKTGIWKKAREYADTKLGKADLERREWARKHDRPNSPYGALWSNLPSKKGSNIKTYGDFTFKWDYDHGGEIEVFQRGEHLGVLDPLTTEWIKHGQGKRIGPKN